MLPLIPFMWTSEWVTCFLASFSSREIGTIQVEHPESNIATLENVMPLTVKVALTSGDRYKESFGNEPRLGPCLSVLLIGSLSAM